jgi:hypothetical protein
MSRRNAPPQQADAKHDPFFGLRIYRTEGYNRLPGAGSWSLSPTGWGGRGTKYEAWLTGAVFFASKNGLHGGGAKGAAAHAIRRIATGAGGYHSAHDALAKAFPGFDAVVFGDVGGYANERTVYVIDPTALSMIKKYKKRR